MFFGKIPRGSQGCQEKLPISGLLLLHFYYQVFCNSPEEGTIFTLPPPHCVHLCATRIKNKELYRISKK
jgi:hypothetical protein